MLVFYDIECFSKLWTVTLILDIADGILFDLYDRYLDTYYDTKDKHEWKNYLLESVEDNE